MDNNGGAGHKFCEWELGAKEKFRKGIKGYGRSISRIRVHSFIESYDENVACHTR
jgi:hypothetical protein